MGEILLLLDSGCFWMTEVAWFAMVAEQCSSLVLLLSALTDAQSVPDVLDLAHYITLSNSFL